MAGLLCTTQRATSSASRPRASPAGTESTLRFRDRLRRCYASLEDNCAATVQQDAVLGVPADGAGERDPLGVAADGGQVLRAVRGVAPGELPLDDRALVQAGRAVVGGRSD